MNRRDVVHKFAIGGTVLLLSPSVLQSCTKDPGPDTGGSGGGGGGGTKVEIDLTLAANAVLNNAGGSKIVQSIIVVNTGSVNYIALSSICTHEGCTVGYNSAASNIKCPCHGSVFTTAGSIVNGPAPTALKSYPVSKAGDVLTITL